MPEDTPEARRWWMWPSALIVAAHVGLALLRSPTRSPITYFALLALGFAGLWIVATRRGRAPSSMAVLGVAVVLRALLIPVLPTLSQDVYRNVWDGRVAAAAYDPYRLAPEARQLVPLRDELYEEFQQHDVPAVSPPLALTLFALVSRLPASIWVLKMVLVLLDVLTCVLLLRLSARLGIDRRRVLWYAWNPLVTLEVAGMGHVEALGVVAAVAAVWYLTTRPPRALASATAAAAGFLAKVVPVVAFPLWARHSRRPGRFLALAVGLGTAAVVPVTAALGGMPPGLMHYGTAWQFNGPIFEPLWRLLEALKDDAGWVGGNAVYPPASPELIAKGLLLALLVGGVVWQLRRRDVVAATGATFAWALLCSPAVYPWHFLWVLPFAALSGQRAWLTASVTISLAYLPRLLQFPYWPWDWLLIWSPFAVTLMRYPQWSTD